MNWIKEKPIEGETINGKKAEGIIIGCLNCGYKPFKLELDTELTVGFGSVFVKKDGKTIYHNDKYEADKTVNDIELMAQKDPDNDWRINFYAPLSETEYQRQDINTWLLIRTGLGFA